MTNLRRSCCFAAGTIALLLFVLVIFRAPIGLPSAYIAGVCLGCSCILWTLSLLDWVR